MVIQWGLWPKSGRLIVDRHRGSLWIVGRWQTISQDIRGQAWVDIRTSEGVIGVRYPPLEACKLQFEIPDGNCSSLRRTMLWGTQWGQLDGRRAPGSTLGYCRSLEIGRSRPYHLATRAFGPTVEPPLRWVCSSGQDSYLVDSASSHMLVSKIKPCMSKYKQSIL